MPVRVRFDAGSADARGLVAMGGDLQPETLMRAYRSGVFPWYAEDMPICWWSPDPRAILPLDGLHISRRLARTMRSTDVSVTFNRDFAGVLECCADRPGEGTWLLPEMIVAYQRVHALGVAHSVEIWKGDRLVGGAYGIGIGGFFSAESMFHRQTDASKIAIVHLVRRLQERGFDLLDIQFLTPHTQRLGGTEIPRDEYLARLKKAIEMPKSFAAT